MPEDFVTKSPYMPRDQAVVRLQEQFQRRAKTLACGDAAIVDDLISEMNTSVLTNKEACATLGYYANGAVQDAKDYLRKHYLRKRPELKLKYTPGEGRAVCRGKATPSICKRESERSGKRKRGRPPSEAAGAKVHMIMRLNPKVRDEFTRMAKRDGITREMLLRGAMALLATRRGDEAMARKFLDV